MVMGVVEIYEVIDKQFINDEIKKIIKKYHRNLDISKIYPSSRVSLYAELTALKREIELKFKK